MRPTLAFNGLILEMKFGDDPQQYGIQNLLKFFFAYVLSLFFVVDSLIKLFLQFLVATKVYLKLTGCDVKLESIFIYSL